MSRNEARLRRRRAEADRKGTVQWCANHRSPHLRGWVRKDGRVGFAAQMLGLLMKRRGGV